MCLGNFHIPSHTARHRSWPMEDVNRFTFSLVSFFSFPAISRLKNLIRSSGKIFSTLSFIVSFGGHGIPSDCLYAFSIFSVFPRGRTFRSLSFPIYFDFLFHAKNTLRGEEDTSTCGSRSARRLRAFLLVGF